jgi:hypothetical protein
MVKSNNEEIIEKVIIARENKNLLRLFKASFFVCISATIAVMGMLYNFGNYLYENSIATQAAIDTFIEVKKHNDKI